MKRVWIVLVFFCTALPAHAGLTASDKAYAKALFVNVHFLHIGLDSFTKLTGVPEYLNGKEEWRNDHDWELKMAQTLTLIDRVAKQGYALRPTRRFARCNAVYQKCLHSYDTMALHFPAALGSSDLSMQLKCASWMVDGQGYIKQSLILYKAAVAGTELAPKD